MHPFLPPSSFTACYASGLAFVSAASWQIMFCLVSKNFGSLIFSKPSFWLWNSNFVWSQNPVCVFFQLSNGQCPDSKPWEWQWQSALLLWDRCFWEDWLLSFETGTSFSWCLLHRYLSCFLPQGINCLSSFVLEDPAKQGTGTKTQDSIWSLVNTWTHALLICALYTIREAEQVGLPGNIKDTQLN